MGAPRRRTYRRGRLPATPRRRWFFLIRVDALSNVNKSAAAGLGFPGSEPIVPTGMDESLREWTGVLDDVAFVEVDASLVVQRWSHGAEVLLGYPAAEVLEKPLVELFLPKSAAAVTELFASLLTAHKVQRHLRLTTRRRATCQVAASVRRLEQGQSGRLLFVLVAASSADALAPSPSQRDVNPLRFNERRQLIFEAAIDGTFLIDDHGTIVDMNPTAERIFGHTREEALGQNIRLVMPQRFAIHHDNYLGAYRNEGRRAVIGKIREVEALRKDGTTFPADLSIAEAQLDGRRYFVGTIRDISERKVAELDRDRMKSLVESTPDFISMSDPAGNLIYQNPAANRMIGWAADADLRGKSIADVHPPWAAKWITESVLPLVAREGACSHETVLQHLDGTEIPVSQVIIAHVGANGELTSFSTIMRDLRSQKRAEALLSKVAAQVRGMLYQLELRPDGTMRFAYASPGSYELYEQTPEAMSQSAATVVASIHPDDAQPFIESMFESARNLTPWSAEFRYIRRDGSLRWHRGQATPERTADGSTLWHGFVTDITDLQAANEELRRTKLELEQAIAAIDAGFALFGPDERLITCNERFSTLYRLSSDECVSQLRYETILRTLLVREPQLADHLGAEPSGALWVTQALNLFRSPKEAFTLRLGERWIRCEDKRTANGGFVCVRTDITALKQSEFEARLQEERLELATKTAEVGIWEIDTETLALTWDARMFELFDCTAAELGSNKDAWREHVHPEDASAIAATFQRAIEDGTDMRARVRVVQKDGRLRHLDVRGSCVRDHDGKLVRLLGVGLDVTEHIESAQRLTRLVESAEAATKAKAEFLATMSHEIRTPMNGVIGMTNLLIATELDDTQREYVETIRSCGEALLSLLNDILDFSKMEAGKLVLEKAPFSLERVVLDCLTLFTSQAEQNGVALVHSLPVVQMEVLGDSVRTRQILLNLISNALKFTRRGHVRVDVETRKVSGTKIVAQLRISDTGIGMAPEHLARLGEAFHQADASTTRRFGGTGLGLTICKTLVHLMDGELRVESTLGKGTTFEVNLPLEVAQLPEVVVDNPHSGPSTARQFRRVLVAEDNVVNQRVVSLMLKPFATEVVIANDGVEAVAAFKSESFDCILMDGQMPNLDGIAATREIRLWERQRGLARIPIIALTANAFAGDRETFIEAGADEYLTKPVRTNDLKGVITRVLRRR